MLKVNLSFAKIVASPSNTSWSQAYNAGNFFVVLSLTNESLEDETLLTSLGKQIIDNLETEFFGLENKNLDTIKQALLASINEVSESTELSLTLAYIKDTVLYVLTYGAGSVTLKRDAKIANILTKKDYTNEILSASGYIKQNDVLVIQTRQFTNLIKADELNTALELTLPNDIAETLSPHVHNSDKNGAAAIIISITGVPAELNEITNTPSQEDNSELEEDTLTYDNLTPTKDSSFIKSKKFNFAFNLNFLTKLLNNSTLRRNKKRLILLTAALIIASLLIITVFINLQKRNVAELQKNYKNVYAQADEKYQEAVSIKSLNPSLAVEILKDADSIIIKNIGKFPVNSDEFSKLKKLQNEIKKLQDNPVAGKEISAQASEDNENLLLSKLLSNKNALYAAEDKNFVYLLSDTNLISIDKNTKNEKELLKNDNDWKNAVSLGTYLGNLYILDKTNGLLKFVVAQDGYGKTNYFTDSRPDLKNAVSMTIDGSIWILSNDSKITKYTKGINDNFSLKGISGFSKPVQIATSQDLNNVYVLDSGAERIVQIQKDGNVKMQFRAAILKNAQSFSVSSDEKTIYVLSDNKIWRLSL